MTQNLPFFSVVVPTYRRPACLTACLGSLAELDYPRDRLEVIVVHDDRGCATPDPRSARFRGQLDLTELCQSHAGPAAARNTGARQARGDYLAFTDDDCLVAPDWLRSLASLLETAPKTACAGRTINCYDRNRYSKSSQMINDFVYQSAAAMKSPFVTSNNLAVPADSFRAVGGFAAVFPHAAGEDREFSALGPVWPRHGPCLRSDRLPRPGPGFLRFLPPAVSLRPRGLAPPRRARAGRPESSRTRAGLLLSRAALLSTPRWAELAGRTVDGALVPVAGCRRIRFPARGGFRAARRAGAAGAGLQVKRSPIVPMHNGEI